MKIKRRMEKNVRITPQTTVLQKRNYEIPKKCLLVIDLTLTVRIRGENVVTDDSNGKRWV